MLRLGASRGQERRRSILGFKSQLWSQLPVPPCRAGMAKERGWLWPGPFSCRGGYRGLRGASDSVGLTDFSPAAEQSMLQSGEMEQQ